MLVINGYKLYQEEPNTIVQGARVYTKTIHFETKNNDKERLIRVYLPSTYDFNNKEKRFPVLYMFDGKNLFDDYTSFVGEWRVDEIVEDFIAQKLMEGIIVVGIDAPKDGRDRSLEMAIENMYKKKAIHEKELGYANLLTDYMFNVVKPDIDNTFFTLKDKKNTGVGGSSMGGIMAFYVAATCGEYIDYALCFSPAFFLYRGDEFINNFVKPRIKNLPKIYLYVGGVGFEGLFVNLTLKVHKLLKESGFDDTRLLLEVDKSQEHNERAWSKYLPSALKFAYNIKE